MRWISTVLLGWSCAAGCSASTGTAPDDEEVDRLHRTTKVGRQAATATLTGPKLTITSNNGTQAAWDIAGIIQGPGLTITSAILECEVDEQAGKFVNGELVLDMDTGAVLSSAFARNAMGTNDEDYPSTTDALNGKGYSPLDNLLKFDQSYTRDACVLHLKFLCDDPKKFEFRYVFGSDDYPSQGNNIQEDVMGAFLNGVSFDSNIATVSGDYVSVNTIFKGTWFKDNSLGAYATEMNGFTQVLTASAEAKEGVNTLHIAVADGGKFNANRRGAWLFIETASMKCPAAPTKRPTKRPTRPTSKPTTIGRRTTPVGQCARRARQNCRCLNFRQCVETQVRRRCTYNRNAPIIARDYIRSVRRAYRRRYC